MQMSCTSFSSVCQHLSQFAELLAIEASQMRWSGAEDRSTDLLVKFWKAQMPQKVMIHPAQDSKRSNMMRTWLILPPYSVMTLLGPTLAGAGAGFMLGTSAEVPGS